MNFDDSRLTAAGLFIEAHAGLVEALGEVHRRHGLSGKDFDALLRLARSPNRRLRMMDLAAQTRTSTSGLTRVVDRLEECGFATRAIDETDRRSWQVELTNAGSSAITKDIAELLAVIETHLLEPLGEHAGPFLEGLRALRDHVHPAAADGAQEPDFSP